MPMRLILWHLIFLNCTIPNNASLPILPFFTVPTRKPELSEDALRRKGIPYRVYGGLSFYQRKEVKDLVAYLRLLVNENDSEALTRIINFPTRGIGETTQNKLIVFADSQNISIAQLLNNLPIYAPQIGLNNGVITKLMDFGI